MAGEDILIRLGVAGVEQVEAAMAKTRTAIGGLVGGAKNMLTNMTQHFKWASLFIGTAMTGITKNILDTAANVEQTRVALETLLKSAPEAGNLMEWMTKFSIQTPLTREQIQKTAVGLIAFGHSAEQAKLGVIAITEATSALGIDAQRVMTMTKSLGQIYSSEKVREVEFNELRLQGVAVNELLAKAVNEGKLKLEGFGTGATATGGATKKMTTAFKSASEKLPILELQLKKAQAGMEAYNKSGKKTAESTLSHEIALKKAQQAVDKATGSVNAYTSAEAGRGKAITAVSQKLTILTQDQEKSVREANRGKDIAIALEDQLIKTYGGAALRQVKTFSGMMSNFGDVFQYVIQRAMGISLSGEVIVGGAFDKIRNAVAKLINFLLDNVDAIAGFFNKILSNGDALVAWIGILAGAFYGFFGGILGPVLIFGIAIGSLSIVIKRIVEHFGGLEVIGGRLKTVFENIKGKIDEIRPSLESFANTLLSVFQGIITTLTPVLRGVFEGLKQAFAEILPLLPQLWAVFQPLLKLFGYLAVAVIIFAGALISGILGGLSQVIAGIIQFVTGFTQAITGLFQIVLGIFSQNSDLIKQGWSGLWQGLFNIFEGFKSVTFDSMAGLITGILNYFLGLSTALHSNVAQMIESIIAKFNEWKSKSDNVIDTLTSSIKDKFINLVGSAANWGRDMVNNWINGIKDAIKGLKGKLGEMAKSNFGLQFQHGGIVPGPIGQPIPIMAHGGERITPTGGTDSGRNNYGGGNGGITINITGSFVIDDDSRIQQLADTISKMLGRQNELYKYGCG